MDPFPPKGRVLAAKFACGSHLHFAYQRQLTENGIDFDTKTETRYARWGESVDMIYFYINKEDAAKAEELTKDIWQEEIKADPVFMKMFWKIFVVAILVFGTILVLMAYNVIR